MTQFHEGQDVEVKGANWYAAKIVCFKNAQFDKDCYLVELADGSRDIFDEAHIRAASINFERLPQKETL